MTNDSGFITSSDIPVIPDDINDLSDVNISSPVDGQTLKYNGTTSKWENVSDNTSLLTQTLVAGTNSVTFTNVPTTGNNIIDFYTSTGINYTAIDTSISGEITLTFPVQSTDVTVWCEIRGVAI